MSIHFCGSCGSIPSPSLPQIRQKRQAIQAVAAGIAFRAPNASRISPGRAKKGDEPWTATGAAEVLKKEENSWLLQASNSAI